MDAIFAGDLSKWLALGEIGDDGAIEPLTATLTDKELNWYAKHALDDLKVDTRRR